MEWSATFVMTEQAGVHEHAPVMLEEVIDALAIKPQGAYIDGTFGRGGHSDAILSRLGPQGRLLIIDRDPTAVAHARDRFGADQRVSIVQGRFGDMDVFCRRLGLAGAVDGILLDLGVSSPQLDDAQRGFSFRRSGPLDMRMDPSAGESAAQWLARAEEQEIAAVLRDYGEEKFSGRIARAIVVQRAQQPVQTTGELAELIARAVPTRERTKDPATRSFQAIRIFINRELDELQKALAGVVDLLAPGGRLVVLSFHSLEDRIVKRFMREAERGPQLPRWIPLPAAAYAPPLRRVGKSRRAGEAETRANPRARSAVLRIAERTEH